MEIEKKLSIGINGFGRIGKLVLRSVFQQHGHDVTVSAINDPFLTPEYVGYLIMHDTTFGHPKFEVETDTDSVNVNGQKIHVYAEKNASEIPWAESGVQYVAETSGFYTTSEAANGHIREGSVNKVLISAPAKDLTTPTFVLGVNENTYDPTTMHVLSNASCTTNCIAPLVKIVHENFGIVEGFMTTIHAATATQKVVDSVSKKDYRSGRSVLQNIIPASTGATKAVSKVLPEMEGKLSGLAFRVPVSNVSVVDLTLKLERPVESIHDITEAIDRAALPHIIGHTSEDVVSSDFLGDARSCIFDVKASMLLNPTFVKLIAYYDNEWAYAARMVEMLLYMKHAETSGVKA